MRVACAKCGIEHDLGDLEPSFRLPDAIFELSAAEQRERAVIHKDFASLTTDGVTQCYVRALIPIRVAGRDDVLSWGVWTAVSTAAYDAILDLWDDPAQLDHVPWHAHLANAIEGDAATVGLPGAVRFADTRQIPHFAFDGEVHHPFAEEARTGVSEERATQWQMRFAHVGA